MSMNCMEAMDCARGVESGAGEVAVLGLCVGRYVQSASVDITELKHLRSSEHPLHHVLKKRRCQAS